MNKSGATDAYLYPKEIMTLPHIEITFKKMSRCMKTEISKDVLSFYGFRRSTMTPQPKFVIDVRKMAI